MTHDVSIESLSNTLKELWLVNKLMIRVRLALARLGLLYRTEKGKEIQNKLQLELKTGKAIPLKLYLTYAKAQFSTPTKQATRSLHDNDMTGFNRDGLGERSRYDSLNHLTCKQKENPMFTQKTDTLYRKVGTGSCTHLSSGSTKFNSGLPSLTKPIYGIFAALGTVFFVAVIRKSLAGISGVFRKDANPPLSATGQLANSSADQGLESALADLTKCYQEYQNVGTNSSEAVISRREQAYKNQLTIVLSSLNIGITRITGLDIHSDTVDLSAWINKLCQPLAILKGYIEELKKPSDEYEYAGLISQFQDFIRQLDLDLTRKFNLWSSKVLFNAAEQAHKLQDQIVLERVEEKDSTVGHKISAIYNSKTPFAQLATDLESLLTLVMSSETRCWLSNACQSFKIAVDTSLDEMNEAVVFLPPAHEDYHDLIGQLKDFSNKVDQLSMAPEHILASKKTLDQFAAQIRALAENAGWLACAKERFSAEKSQVLKKIKNTTSAFQTPARGQVPSNYFDGGPVSPGAASAAEKDPAPSSQFQSAQSDINYLSSSRLDRHNKSQNPILQAFRRDDDGSSASETDTSEAGSLELY